MRHLKNRKAFIALILAFAIITLQTTNFVVFAAANEEANLLLESTEESTEVISTEESIDVESTETSTETESTEISTETESTELTTEESTEVSTEFSTENSTEIQTSDSTEEATNTENTEVSTEVSTNTESIDSLSDESTETESTEESTETPNNLPPKGTYDTNFTTKWATPLTKLSSTTAGIDISFKTINGVDTIIYTIPNDFQGTEININAVQDSRNIKGSSYVPGDLNPFTIKIVNNSNYKFSYTSGSFVLTTENLSTRFSNFIANAIGFDGSPIAYEYAGCRTANIALQSLLGTNLSADLLTDEALGNKLIESGYSNGIADLDKYYLDYCNNFMGTSVGRLEDFSDDVIVLILTGTNSGIKETNKQVAELTYNWFYNRMLSVIPAGVSEDSTYNFTVGEYMRNHSLYEAYCRNAFNNLVADSESTLNPIKLYSNAKSPIDTYTGFGFGYLIGMKLNRTVGNLEISKVDEQGILITSSPAEFVVFYLDKNQQPMYYTSTGSFTTDINKAKLATTNGKLTIKNLPTCKFYIKEITAPADYTIDTTVYEVNITSNETAKISITNKKIPKKPEYGSLKIVKVDENNNEITSSPAEFKLYKLDDKGSIVYYNGSDFKSSEKDALVLSTKEGSITVKNLLLGTYFIIETKAPEGYDLDSSEHKIDITSSSLVTFRLENKKTPDKPNYGSLRIVKVDENSKKITSSPAEFKLYKYDENRTEVYYNGSDFTSSEKDALVLSTKDGIVTVNNLPFDTYYIKETKAPEGYDLDSSVYKFLLSGVETIEIRVVNTKTPDSPKYGSLRIVKVDKNNKKITSSSAEFILYKLDDEGKKLYYNGSAFTSSEKDALVLSTKDGVITVEKLQFDTYYIKETKAPEGYELDSTEHKFTLSGVDTLEFQVVNNKTPEITIIPDIPTIITQIIHSIPPKTGDNTISKIMKYVTFILFGAFLFVMASYVAEYRKIKYRDIEVRS